MQRVMTNVFLNSTDQQQSAISCRLRTFIFKQRITFLPPSERLFTRAKNSLLQPSREPFVTSFKDVTSFWDSIKTKILISFFQLCLSNAYHLKPAVAILKMSSTQICPNFLNANVKALQARSYDTKQAINIRAWLSNSHQHFLSLSKAPYVLCKPQHRNLVLMRTTFASLLKTSD